MTILKKILFKLFREKVWIHIAIECLVSKFDAEAEQKFIKELIPRYASGNVLIQQGRFLVSEDIERRKNKISSYRFGVL